ncbi:MAG: hypothetical protein QNL62_14140 [Gammaproteobacteria bacterium]|nr:hypothetical protein [Gammaproteobacteria bacterium]
MFGCKSVAFIIVTSLVFCQGCNTDDGGLNTGITQDKFADGNYSNNQSGPKQASKKQITDRMMSDGMTGKQTANREIILAFKKLRGEELRKQYGAHSLGIGWQRVNGYKTDQLALVFYVESAASDLASSIPATFEFVREGESQPISIPTTVVETAKPGEEKPD